MKPKQEYKINIFLQYLCVSCVILLGLLSIIGSGGGGGGNGNVGNAPEISNLWFSPTSAIVGDGGGTTPVTGTFDFVDNDGNVSTLTLTVFDSNNNMLDRTSDPIQGISGITSGKIQGVYDINTSFAGDFKFEVYITDTTNLDSNILTGTFVITNPAWKTKTSMPLTRKWMDAETVNDKIYIIGGSDGVTLRNETMVYDPVTDTWSFAASIPTVRLNLTVCSVNGKIYAIGGSNLGALDTVEEYDPTTDTWATKTPMPTVRFSHAAAVVNGKIYAIGGENNIPVLNIVEEYDPTTDTWATKSPMPTSRSRLAAAAVNGKIYVIGGLNGGGFFSGDVEEYDPVTDTWSIKAPMPTPRRDFALAVVNGKIYAIGGIGYDSNNVLRLDVMEEYDPVTDTWATKAQMPTGRLYLAASSANQKIYAFGGSSSSGGGAPAIDIVEEYDVSLD